MAKHKYYYLDTPKRPKVKRRLAIIIFGIIGLFLFYGMTNSNDSETNVVSANIKENQSPEDIALIQAQAELDKLKKESPLHNLELPIVGQSAIGTDSLGTIKTSANERQVPIASITKLVTALVILDKQPLLLGQPGDLLTLTAQDEQYYHDYLAIDGTLTAVTAGLTMSQYEALQAMLLPSSNNMADSLVDRYFLSMQEYLDYANQYLQDKGLVNTKVADASGFSPDSQSTPSDLIKLAQLSLSNPVIKHIVAQPDANISVAGDIINYNPIINDPDVIGLKPGATDEAGLCLLFAAELPTADGNTETVVAVILGYSDRQEYVQTARNIVEEARSLLKK
jgi:D-alanyl-D-alanine carboxypeptidase (penicillin-binding protein 5/6)